MIIYKCTKTKFLSFAEMFLLGYAQVMTIPPNVKYADMFLEFEREARKNGNGLWAAVSSAVSVSGIMITQVYLAREIVTIENQTFKDIDISGWKLISERGNQS